MSAASAIAVLILLDLAAVGVTILVAGSYARGWLLGTICGLAAELIRIFLAMGITKAFGIGTSLSPSEFLVWLINLRLFNIPILVGIGFFAGSAAQQRKS